jgi:hypothetical protein
MDFYLAKKRIESTKGIKVTEQGNHIPNNTLAIRDEIVGQGREKQRHSIILRRKSMPLCLMVLITWGGKKW